MTALLEVDSLAKSFSGVRAVDGISFAVRPNTITGIIGPNGSGKSTTIDCISGFQRIDAGRVRLAGIDITGRPPQLIARAGLMRTFQTVRTYEQMSLVENLLIAAQQFDPAGWWDELARTRQYREARQAATERARELIALIGLSRYAEIPTGILSYGQKKLVALAAALMPQPKIVILDEPVAGVNPTRIREVEAVIHRLHAAGETFLIIEHNVEFITNLCGRVLVFDQGRKLMEGTPAEVHGDPRVLAAYLGGAETMTEPERGAA
jgi:ABC-type branched-subunit amino acid transport system ATPase component